MLFTEVSFVVTFGCPSILDDPDEHGRDRGKRLSPIGPFTK